MFLLSLLPCLTLAAEALPSDIPLADFASHPKFQEIKISPDGSYLAAKIQNDEGNMGLAVLKRGERDLGIASVMQFNGQDSLGSFYWANNERLIMTITRQLGSFDRPAGTGDLFAMNADGSKKMMIFGPRGERQKTYAGSQIISFLKGNDDEVLLATQPFGLKDASYPTVYRLNIYSGRLIKVTKPPVKGFNVLADNKGQVRFAVGADLKKGNENVVIYRDSADDDWRELARFSEEKGEGLMPIAFFKDNKRVIASTQGGSAGDTAGIVVLDTSTGKKTKLYQRDDVDVSPIIAIDSEGERQVIGATWNSGKPEQVFFDSANDQDYVSDYKGLIAAFPDKAVSITSATRDMREMVIAVYADNEPGQFYLFNRESKQVTFLLSAMPWLDSKLLAKVRPISYQARDGKTIHGYLTLPKGKNKDLPLVMMPHGGPHGVRDEWGYDPSVQVLASRGYAVFQPNFRGSGGFGSDFMAAGYKKWGTSMIDDMTDGVNYLIGQGIVDKNRVCSMGGSYGGYAAVMSAEREPDLYRCAVGYVGVYDLEMLSSHPGAYRGLGSDNFRKKVLPDSEAELRAQSPRYQVAKLKAPVLIVAGGKDEIAPIEHSEALRDAMEAAGKPYEWYVEPNEGHGFYLPEHNQELYKRVLTFLDKHIGQ
ncbi:alpha/beta hydrolase family protein [Gallaecimonas xiamenensis]|uniref:alpha/beta hydrolase family protein n=1 Tax=Gallaecimonas xiamenensis TaxID=1207039 RepID=UPI0004BA66FB|nr:S9 family peptidase [Gallaecimonas xiamenensis]